MKRLVAYVSLLAVFWVRADNGQSASALVVPQDVSWSLKQIGLTRSLEDVSGGNKTVRNQTQNLTSSENFKTTSSKNAERGSSKESSRGWSAEGKASAGVKWGVVPTASAEGSVGGKTSNDNAERTKESSATGSASAKEQSKQNVDGSTSEGLEEERYGGYCLKFALALKSNNPADSFRVCATNAKIRLKGLTVPVVIPCDYGEFTLGAEERILDFVFPIKDQTLLRELVAVAAQGAWQKLSVELVGYEFPIIAEASGRNVITEMRVAEQNSPTTEIAVEFGDVARLSPWRVKQRYGRSSGKRGKLVTVRDALLAINELVAVNDEMPEQLFEFDKTGMVTCVCDVPFVQKPSANNDLRMIGVRIDGDDNGMTVHPLTVEQLQRPIREFTRVEFLAVELSDVIKAIQQDESCYGGLRKEVLSFLKDNNISTLWQLQTVQTQSVSVAKSPEAAENNEPFGMDGQILVYSEWMVADVDVFHNGKHIGMIKGTNLLSPSTPKPFTCRNVKVGDDLTFVQIGLIGERGYKRTYKVAGSEPLRLVYRLNGFNLEFDVRTLKSGK